ncbi:MAG: YgjV family protein [Alphaproteobacteria bacterium]
MTPYIIAQSVGLLGYLFFISATQFKTRRKIIQIETLAYLILCLQWYLLGQTTLMSINILFIITSFCALYANKNPKIQNAMPLLYPLCGLALLTISHYTLIDILAMVALFCTIASKSSNTITTFRSYAIITAITFIVCAILTMSIVPLIFNAIFALGHSYRLWTIHKPTLHIPNILKRT